MPILRLKVLEKWSKLPINEAEVFLNNILIGKTDEKGDFTIELTAGSAIIEVKEFNHEPHKQTLNITSNVLLNISMTPWVIAL
jgi:hypothetical protein